MELDKYNVLNTSNILWDISLGPWNVYAKYKGNYFTYVCVHVRACVWSVAYMFFAKINIDFMRHNNSNYFHQIAI